MKSASAITKQVYQDKYFRGGERNVLSALHLCIVRHQRNDVLQVYSGTVIMLELCIIVMPYTAMVGATHRCVTLG